MRFTIAVEPRRAEYRRLLEVAMRRCDQALLVVRGSLSLSSNGTQVLSDLAPNLVAVERKSYWPGTILYGEEATLHRFKFDEYTIKVLRRYSDALYDWHQPDLPEDLCLLDFSGQPWLVTIAHENDAYLDVDPSVVAQVLSELGGIRLIPENTSGIG